MALSQEIRRHQIEDLLRNWHWRAGLQGLLALGVALALARDISTAYLVGWLVSAALATGALIWAGLRWRRADAPPVTQETVTGAHVALGLTGAMWGALAVCALPLGAVTFPLGLDQRGHEMFVVFAMVGLTTGAIAPLALLRAGSFAFLVGAMLPTITGLVVMNGVFDLALAGALTVFVLALAIFIQGGHAARCDTIKAALDNANLVAQLSEAHAHLSEAIERSPAAIALFDSQERLVICNEKYREFFVPGAKDRIRPGVRLRTVLELIGEGPQRPPSAATAREYVETRLARHRSPGQPWETELGDGRWVQGITARTRDGGSIIAATDITDRVKRDLAFEEYSQLLQATLENMDQGLIAVGPTKRIIAANRRVETVARIPHDLLRPGCPFEGVIRHAAERGDYGQGPTEEHVTRLMRNFEQPEPHRLERVLPDGTTLEIRGQPLPDGGFVITYTNITDRKRIEDALLESEERFRGLVEQSQELIMILRNHHVVFINRAGVRMLGAVSEDQIIGMHVLDILDPSYVEIVKQRIRRMEVSGRPAESMHQEYRRLDGGTVDVEVTSTPFAHPEGLSIQVVARDISERLKAEQALRESEARFRVVVDNSPTKIHIKDLDGRYMLLNRKAEILFGVTDEEAKGKTTSDIFPAQMSDKFRAHDRAVIETGDTIEQEEEFTLDDGVHTFLTVKFPIRDANGAITAVGAIGTEITERKRIEEALRGAKEEAELASRSKSEFLANMSHELRTPLNAIIGFSEILANQLMGPIEQTAYLEYAKDIHYSGTHLLSLINDILDLSKVEAGKFELQEEDLDVGQTIEAAVRIIRERVETAELSLEVNVEPDLPPLYADSRAIKQMLLNLMSNAVKFTPAGGSVRAAAGFGDDGRFYLRVADTGVGIAREDMERALSPFGQVVSSMTRQHTGTGLGLPLVKSLAELHGAELRVDSAPQAGTTATIVFPLERCRARTGSADRDTA
ncbi:MAG: PAS-domain containing protein [Alphaproteobacteria bacterium]|nr:PAS-domain containing protein [Alphaproteobacteria bacterium]